MEIKIEEDIALPDDWAAPKRGIRGNVGWPGFLRKLKIGQSFEYKVTDKKTEKDFINCRQAIYQLRKDKYSPRNYVVRLQDKGEYHNQGEVITYRIWAAPMDVSSTEQKAKKA